MPYTHKWVALPFVALKLSLFFASCSSFYFSDQKNAVNGIYAD